MVDYGGKIELEVNEMNFKSSIKHPSEDNLKYVFFNNFRIMAKVNLPVFMNISNS